MKVAVIAFLLGVALASGTAYAASPYWKNSGTTYACSGGPTSVFCHETNYYTSQQYQVAIIPGLAGVKFGKTLIFSCNRKKRPAGNCTYYGQ